MKNTAAVIIALSCSWAYSAEQEFVFNSSFDCSEQKAVAYVPDGGGDAARPLLVIAHFMSGDRFTAKSLGYYAECEKRGWLLVCPDQHGHRTDGKTALGSLESQHDVIDCVDFMKRSYKVDATRIYIAGRSMGGMHALLCAAKYPDIFAAVVAGQPITDLAKWHEEVPPGIKSSIEKECGELSEKTNFEYARRSPISYVSNLQYLPVILWHGTEDRLVPPGYTSLLHLKLREICPYQPEVKWLVGAPHGGPNMPASWVCGQLEIYQNIREGGAPVRNYASMSLTTDESKSFYWLGVRTRDPERFGSVSVFLEEKVVFVKSENIREISIDTKKLAPYRLPKSYKVVSDGGLHFRIVKDGAVQAEFETDAESHGEIPTPESRNPKQ